MCSFSYTPTTALNNFFFINTGSQKQKLNYSEIYYIEGEGNYVNYHTSKGKILARSTIKKTLHLLPKNNFIQIHRSYLIALNWIDKIEDNHVFLANKKIAIGATYKTHFLEIINNLNT